MNPMVSCSCYATLYRNLATELIWASQTASVSPICWPSRPSPKVRFTASARTLAQHVDLTAGNQAGLSLYRPVFRRLSDPLSAAHTIKLIPQWGIT